MKNVRHNPTAPPSEISKIVFGLTMRLLKAVPSLLPQDLPFSRRFSSITSLHILENSTYLATPRVLSSMSSVAWLRKMSPPTLIAMAQ